MTLKRFFVYGTLRPDIKAPWSDQVHNNPSFKFTYYKSFLPFSKLYFHKQFGYPVCYCNKLIFNEHDKTVGYILEVDNLEPALKVFDEIEDYPNNYDRQVVECYNEELQDVSSAYFYTIKEEQFIEEIMVDIKMNDWALYPC
jgi:gamma-glutamylcyclotransferase (GGCT)/AIG2-like uncharacterized protein YtfP